MRDVVESKAKMKLGGSHAVIYWMIRWAAMALTRFMVGVDGMAAYERRRGRRCRVPIVSFGETVWYKSRLRDRNTLEVKCEKGVWLGHARDSNETIVGTIDGALRAYAIKRLPEDERWSSENSLRI